MTRHTICDTDDLPVGSHWVVTLGNRLSICVYNVRGRFVAVRNFCPHAGAPLCQGELTGTAVSDRPHQRRWAHDGEILKCPWHGWEFKLPEGVTVTEPPVRLRKYEVFVDDGRVVVEDGAVNRKKASS
jgi:nitrite reductase/ring-hydroxylating ferredoxin subunit